MDTVTKDRLEWLASAIEQALGRTRGRREAREAGTRDGDGSHPIPEE